MDIIMTNNIKLKLKKGQYIELEELLERMEILMFRDIMMSIAYETESINVYGFLSYMIQKHKEEEWLKLTVDIMINPLCFIEGAYSIALFHTRQLLSINRNAENLERLLFFYNIPEKLIDQKEAYCLAEELLCIEPDNKVALQIKNSNFPH